ncbi:hypothetical protein DESC_920032 [Desulfosarcina cetonica]|nr:hypothetical protein DESC_920032 [Desulfosarcina cetonica]
MYFGGPYWNRTNNLLIKSQVLCLVELTALIQARETKALPNSLKASCQCVFYT